MVFGCVLGVALTPAQAFAAHTPLWRKPLWHKPLLECECFTWPASMNRDDGRLPASPMSCTCWLREQGRPERNGTTGMFDG
jgi:hypothetical protein